MGETKDILITIFAIVIIVLGLPALFDPKVKRWKKVLLTIFLVLFAGLSIDQYFRNKKEKRDADTLTNELRNDVKRMSENLIKVENEKLAQTNRQLVFEEALFREFKILRDTVLNKPVQKNSTINIQNVRTFNMY